MKNLYLIFVLFASFCLFSFPVNAQNKPFHEWLIDFKIEAQSKGISKQTIDAALSDIQPIQRVIDLDKKQPEKKITFAQYKKNVVNQQRINEGRALLQKHAKELSFVEQKYGVPSQFIVALWGVETNFGANTGGFKIVPALATLAWEGRRAEFFKQELFKALKIIDEGHIAASDMKGSWAGAMGQNQFMPSSFFAYAVDENGDGHKDIWNTKLDVFASTANYLAKSGWNDGEKWGRRIILPQGFSKELATPKIQKPISYWSSLGVRTLSGAMLPNENMTASIVAPDGVNGEAYIVYNNYQVIMKWNRSTYFATSVGLIADALTR